MPSHWNRSRKSLLETLVLLLGYLNSLSLFYVLASLPPRHIDSDRNSRANCREWDKRRTSKTFDGTCIHVHVTCSQWTPVTEDSDTHRRTHTHSKMAFFLHPFYFSLLTAYKDVRLPLQVVSVWKSVVQTLKECVLETNIVKKNRLINIVSQKITSFMTESPFQKFPVLFGSSWPDLIKLNFFSHFPLSTSFTSQR